MAKIIITDDEPMNRRMTEFMLTKNGYETVKAASSKGCFWRGVPQQTFRWS